jgi:hypothetical protein
MHKSELQAVLTSLCKFPTSPLSPLPEKPSLADVFFTGTVSDDSCDDEDESDFLPESEYVKWSLLPTFVPTSANGLIEKLQKRERESRASQEMSLQVSRSCAPSISMHDSCRSIDSNPLVDVSKSSSCDLMNAEISNFVDPISLLAQVSPAKDPRSINPSAATEDPKARPIDPRTRSGGMARNSNDGDIEPLVTSGVKGVLANFLLPQSLPVAPLRDKSVLNMSDHKLYNSMDRRLKGVRYLHFGCALYKNHDQSLILNVGGRPAYSKGV